jgi:hypothetical protein
MDKYLLVPIHLDALHLKNGTSVAEAMVEFNRLPYFSGKRDVNPDIVNLSESIVSQPFQNKNLYLKLGIHLHWALPDALTKESQDSGFPCVPNRWLITRKNGNKTDHWIVESDYLYSIDSGFQENSITYPYQTDEKSPPFRYLGRKYTLEEWLNQSKTNPEYLEKLTAIGYGEPTFAAFYPNCCSVFGFHDPEFTDSISNGLQYNVIGWYSNQKQDYLSELLTQLNKQISNLTPEAFIEVIEKELKWKFQPNNEDWKKEEKSEEKQKKYINAVKQELNWVDNTFNTDSKTPQIICYSRLMFNSSNSQGKIQEKTDIKLAVANTGTEALSAYLAQTLDQSEKYIIEEQLEALQFAESLENQQLDTGAKFQEIRHEASFNAVSGGFLWKINIETKQSNFDNQSFQTKLNLPSEIASLLAQLNQKQQEYDCELAKINSRRRQLFSDWYKYMVSTYPPEDSWDNYPDIDAVKYYIEKEGLSPLQSKLNEIGELDLFQDNTGKFSRASSSNSSLASELAGLINDLIGSINTYNQTLQNNYNKLDEDKKKETQIPPIYFIERVSSPRYWQPKEPVVLIVGDDVKASQRHGEDGLLECHLLEINKTIQYCKIIEDFKPILDKINVLQSQNSQNRIGFSIWQKQPWNPFLLQWLVEIFPVAHDGHKTSSNPNYNNDFLSQNYVLNTDDIDLSAKSNQSLVLDTKENRIKTDSDSNIYSGFSILTNYANSLLKKRIEEYLEKYDNKDNQQNPILQIAKKAQEKLNTLNCLSQCLGGFNEALLMHKQTLQLGINDPIGFDYYKEFTQKVAEAVKDEIKSAPQPLDDFSPIRSGEMRIIELQLIDTFGQVRKLEWKINSEEYVIKPESMKAKDNNKIVLPPRFVQPCRINFRWLSVNNQDNNNQETNAHPNSNPICGWILPNNLNNSLMIYDSKGQALGSININGEWDDAPGSNPIPTTVIEGKEFPNISNIHLHKLVKNILTLGSDFVKKFNLCLNNALNNIDPENFAQHQSLALLMGRAIAVVRASINLELLGLPAINQDWNIFRQEMKNNTPLEERDTDNFVNVKFPIRIGEYQQLNDGVIGYWKEDQNGKYEGNIFYDQQSDSNESKYIKTQYWDESNNPKEVEEGAINIMQSINSDPQILTMLVDPRCVFHATSGILPSKSITIPSKHYTEALENIKITFLTAPILTDINQLHLPLLNESDYNWSWLEKRKDHWSEISTIPFIEKETFTKYLKEKSPEANSQDQEYWQTLFTQNWLNPTEQVEKAIIVNKDKRPKLTGILQAQDNLIEEIFDLGKITIEPVSTQAKFASQQEIREGWLVLTKVKAETTKEIG